jgi:hypothetical protein
MSSEELPQQQCRRTNVPKSDPAGGSPNRRGLVPRHYRLEPPYCAVSLVARAAIDYTAALFFVLR